MERSCIDTFFDAYNKVDYWWRALDSAIFSAVAREPRHTDVEEVYGKVALINRAYRTNLAMAGDDPEWRLAERMVGTEVDKTFMGEIGRLNRFDRNKLPIILQAHEHFVGLTRDVTNRIENS